MLTYTKKKKIIVVKFRINCDKNNVRDNLGLFWLLKDPTPLRPFLMVIHIKLGSFWATDVNRKSRFLLFDAYFTLFIQKVKLKMLKWELCNSLVGHENVLKARP